MRVPSLHCALSIALLTLIAAPSIAQPDVIVGDITGPSNYSTDPGYDAFSLGTTSCNVGNQNLTWISSTNQHPVIGGQLYKYDPSNGGRFTMVGRSWLKHGFGALQQNLCGTCTGSGNFQALGVLCSDPYGSSLNGSQAPLGPRSEVNASTGYFPYPPSNPAWSGNTDRRLKVPLASLDTSSTYVSEAHYVQPEDATSGNDNNNASYRMSAMSGGPSNYSLSFTGPTVREEPAISAWQVLDPGVALQTVEIPGADGGQLTLGIKRTDNGNGTHHFEVCLHNLNAHDAVSGVAFMFASGVAITNQGWHAPEWTDNSVYNNNPWNATTTSTAAVWMVDSTPAATANVIRWATSHSFWFDSSDADILGTNIDLLSGSSTSFPAPPFPTEDWETNGADAHLDIDGNTTNDPFVGPIVVAGASGVPHVATLDGIAGQPYELYLTSVPAVGGYYTSLDGEIVNLDLTSPTFFPFFGTNPIMPAGGVSIPFNLGGTWFFAGQLFSANPAQMQGFSLSAATELTLEPLPRVTVECVGANSYSTNASGFWRINHLGTTGAVITSVVLSFQGASGPANGVYFDTDQSLPSSGGSHNLGNTYRQGSAAATGLDLAASSPYANSGFIGSNNISGASFSTIEFQFTGGSFNGNSLLFDSDTDPGTQSAASHVGMLVTVTLSTGETLNGTLAADPQNANRSFVEFQ